MKRFSFIFLKIVLPLILVLVVFASPQITSRFSTDKGDPAEYEAAMSKLKMARGQKRNEALGDAGLQSARLGNLEQAERLALELDAGSPTDGDDLENLHTALGLVALKRGNLVTAKDQLLASGRAPGTPVRASFGPTMVLAKGLLKAGEKDTVLQYFGLCRVFWGYHEDKLNQWTRDVQRGIPPDFGYNLK